MGQSIARIHLENDVPVYLADIDLGILSSAVNNLSSFVTPESRLHVINDEKEWQGFKNCDLVIEAVPEEYKIKDRVLRTVEPFLHESAILSTNTSSIALDRLCSNLEHPENFAGFHFCHPIENRELVEIVATEETKKEHPEKLVKHARYLGKHPLPVGNSPGFVVNRLLAFYMNDTMELVLDGVDFEQIEEAAVEFGMPVGPLTQLDSLGIDIGVRVGQNLFWTYPTRMIPSELLVRMYKAGFLGRKTGEGFYRYNEAGEKIGRSGNSGELIQERLREKKEYNKEEIQNRLFLPWVVEASLLLEDGIVPDSATVDQALSLGLGYQHPAGGILSWADQVGINEIIRRLRNLESLGERYQPTDYLLDLAKRQQGFHSNPATKAA